MTKVRIRGKSRPLQRIFSAAVLGGLLGAGAIGAAPAASAIDVQSKQWYLDAMHAEEIWETSTGEGVKVAVIDSGVNPSTPSLKGQVLKGMDATGVKGDETDDYDGHGTTMAELIAGTGKGGGLQGLAPGAKIIPFRVTDTDLQNRESVNAFDQQEAIRAAADSDAQIINMSMGSEYYNARIHDAVEYAQRKGKLFFASVGNTGHKENKKEYPASYPEVVGVAASGPDGRVTDYSQHGDFVDLAAPGKDIPLWCDQTFQKYCDGDGGTSAATALASASAALIWSAHPEWTANQVLRVMLESAGRGKDGDKKTLSEYYGYGVIRPGAHINRGLGKPGDPDINPLTNQKTGPDAENEKPSSSSKKPTAPPSSEAPEGKPGAEAAVSASDEQAGGGSLGLVIGGAAAAAALAGGAFVMLRRRRSL
ncbi:S8 family serine peptidase [Streptomyces sp. F63]|uniref:S8 family serine peptidase n=1 Tax=Streptomyces sp. F63 TaxID=2824887 RepID=UPI001FFDDEAE|nr:S8 family serine peptidase [Streptomyces sp. F63]